MNQLFIPQTYSELVKWADVAAKSDLTPKGMRGKPADILLTVQFGSQLGMNLMESLRGIAVINGTPSLFGDSLLAMCKRHPECEDIIETPIMNGAEIVGYVCEARRKGHPPVLQRFTVDDAKRAKLWGKEGPWQTYPQRMLQMRARSWALRDQFADMLHGTISAEEAGDMTGTIDGSVINARQLEELIDLLSETNTDSTAFLTTMWTGIDKLEDIPAADFHRAKVALMAKKQRQPPQPPGTAVSTEVKQ